MDVETTIVLDEQGEPVLMHQDELHFALRKGGGHPLVQTGHASPIVGQSVPSGAISGNPNHEPGTGRFGRGSKRPPRTLVGHELLNKIDKDWVRSRAEAAGADTLALLPTPQGIKVVLIKQGQPIDSFTIVDKDMKGVPPVSSKPPNVDEEEWQRRMDAVRDAAREFEDFDVEDLRDFVAARINRTLSDAELRQLASDVRRQRLDDLVDAIDALLRSRLEGRARRRRHVSVRTPRGWIKRTFNQLSDDEIDFVLDRLIHRGFTPEDVRKYVIDVRLRSAARNADATDRLTRRVNARSGSNTT